MSDAPDAHSAPADENAPSDPPRAKGKALPRSGIELDRMSEITGQDIARARASWKRRAPEPYKGLIDAKPEPKGETP